ncbi:cysteine hydrolase family protein [Microbacterium terricola]|uniref:Isochorismatase n=1 Tax=Microbacterium terricola TaxID=344163 RepID=A0ABM8E288_9MICO|nr:cysteine hydrolase family protein [Microbacterium terricola]UYK40439.1 cysteine hydrolase [Microbacterium terricola]BDV31841.1 isochorismatase [Microbacterium terricola]
MTRRELPTTEALLIIDIQNDYFPGGAHPLSGPVEAAEHAQELLAHFRSVGRPAVHVQHIWDAPDAPFMRPGTAGVEIHTLVAPQADEPVVTKAEPNSFLDTRLQVLLEEIGVDRLVVCGMMSSMCVDSTVRAASDLGYAVTVAHDACAAPDLSFGDTEIPGATVHASFMAALAGGYARVIPTREVIAEPRG